MARKKHLKLSGNSNGNATNGDETVDASLQSLSNAILTFEGGICSGLSHDECMAICEEVIVSENMRNDLSDYLDLSEKEADRLLDEAFDNISCDSDEVDSVDSPLCDEDDDECSLQSISSMDEFINDGECELCEREVKLTRHHLIPKSTWKDIKPRFLEASKHYKKGDLKEVSNILNLGNELPIGICSTTFKSGINVKLYLAGYTANLCGPCHANVHKYHSNIELAERYNTIDKILEDERIYKFCRWQSKQKGGKHIIHRRR